VPSKDARERDRACNDARLLEAERLLEQGTFRVLSLDVFDTLVWRTVPEPVDAFVLLGSHLREQGVLRDGISPELFARLRERAELRARGRVAAAGGVPEVRLDAIHREMPGHLYTVPAADVADLEVDFEKTITFPDLEIVRLAERAQSEHGLRIVLVSDTYFSGAELRRILDREPFDALKIDDVFTSSQYGTGKGFGLYRTVLEILGLPAGEVLHIGDNADADEERARAEGIRTVLFDKYPGSLHTVLSGEGLLRRDHRQTQKATLDPVRGDFGLTALRAKAVSQVEGAGLPASTNPYWRFGATVLGPVFTGLAEWMHQRAEDEGVDTIYCLMREGEFLSRLVNGARGYLGSPVRGETLWLSRQVCSRAAIFEAGMGELQTFLDRRVRPTVAELCETLGLELTQLPDLQSDADTRLDDRELAITLLHRITEQPHLRAAIVSRAAALRGRLVDYVTRTVRPTDGRIVVADLGWGGTIQAKLDAALATAGADLRTVGLYLLTNEGALDRTLDGLEAYGFLANGGIPDHTFWITRSPEILEQVCMHDEGTLVDFTDDAEPLLRPTPQSGAQGLQRAAVQRGILAFQDHWARYREHLPVEARRLGPGVRSQLTKSVTRFVVTPTTEEVSLFADWLHDQNYGSEAIDPVLRDTMVPMLQYLTPRQLLELPMAKVYWPFGMAAMHNPQLALGTGAVLSGMLPADAFEAGQPCAVRVFVDSGGGFDEAVRKLAGPNVNGLSYVLAEVATRPLRGVMLRCSDDPGLLRLDWLTLSFDLAGEQAPYQVRIERPGDFSRLQFRNGVLLAENVLLGSRAAPEVVFRTPPEVAGAAYRVEVEAAFAWMATPRLRGRRSSRAEVAVQLGRKVAGKARNVWRNSEQEANERFRPEG
jgi:hypothetical protein